MINKNENLKDKVNFTLTYDNKFKINNLFD